MKKPSAYQFDTNQKSFLFSRKAFSLLEVMVVIGLMGIISYGIMSMLENTTKSQKKMTIKDDILNTSNQLRAVLSDTTTCKTAVKFTATGNDHLPSIPGSVPVSYPISELSSTTSGVFFAKVGAASPSVTNANVTSISMDLQELLSVTASVYKYRAQIQVKYTPIDSRNGTFKPSIFPMIVTFDSGAGNALTSCSINSVLTAKDVCEGSLGGVYDETKTPNCRLPTISMSSSRFISDLGSLAASSTLLAVESTAGAERGLAIYGSLPKINFYTSAATVVPGPATASITVPAANTLTLTANTTNISATANIIGNASIGGTASITGNTSIGGTTTVAGVTTLNGAGTGLQVANAASVGGGLTVTGATTLSSTLAVTGAATLNNTATINGNATMNANMSVAGTGSVTGAFTALSTITATGNVTTNGLIMSNGAGTSVYIGDVRANSFQTTSDRRLKKDINLVSEMIDRILDLKVYSFKYKNSVDRDRLHFGFMADELKELFPNLVTADEDGYYRANYVELVPVLVKSVQELNSRLVDNQKELQSLRSEIELMRKEMKLMNQQMKKIK